MTKKNILKLTNDEVIFNLVLTSIYITRSYKIKLKDLQDFEYLCNELQNRNLLTEEQSERLKNQATL